jgi:hypothetical protein
VTGLTRTYWALSAELLRKATESMRSLLVLWAVRVSCVVVEEHMYSRILRMCRHACVLAVHYYVSSCYYIWSAWAVRVGRIHIEVEVVVYHYMCVCLCVCVCVCVCTFVYDKISVGRSCVGS